jgi:hypothetical protein
MKRLPLVALALATLLLSGCSTDRLATRHAVRLAVASLPAYDRETDLDFAAQALAGQLKFLEGLLESAPEDPALLLAAARSFARYTYGFVELDLERARQCGTDARRDLLERRAADFYARARSYAQRALAARHPELALACESGLDRLRVELQKAEPADAAALFWIAFATGNLIAHRPISPESLGDLARTELLMRRVVELADTLEQAGAHTYLGALYGRLPAFLGGDRDQAACHFRRAMELNGGNYLPARLEQAEYALRATGDFPGYTETLAAIADSQSGLLPAVALDNAVARRKAALRAAPLGTPVGPADTDSVTDCTTMR